MAIAMPSTIADWMITGARTTVRMCRPMIRRSDSPDTRAASTYSSSRTPRTAV